jgi:uncharacterized protein YjiS (DUF1127 family)
MNSRSNVRVTVPTRLVRGSVPSVNQPQETKMIATAIIERAAARRAGALARRFSACLDRIERYFIRRIAIEWLRELDERALRDIGLARSQIVAAVHGFMPASELGEGMMNTSSTPLLVAVGPRARGRASAAELIPWS